MIATVLVVMFLAVVMTGPAGQDWRAERHARRERPSARVMYLPSDRCREKGTPG